MNQQFSKLEQVVALDTLCGVWREASIIDIGRDFVELKFKFPTSKFPVMRELIHESCIPDSNQWPVRKINGETLVDATGRRYPSRRRTTPQGNPISCGDKFLQATGLFGYTDKQLQYKPRTLQSLEKVSSISIVSY